MSAYPDREFHRRGLEAGAMAFLDKKDLDAATLHHILEDIFVSPDFIKKHTIVNKQELTGKAILSFDKKKKTLLYVGAEYSRKNFTGILKALKILIEKKKKGNLY